MKKIKYFLFAALALAFVGCTEDATDDNDNGSSSSGDTELYFEDGLISLYEVSATSKTFSFPITRSNGASAATYEYEVLLDGDGYITFDSKGEVSFASGETEAYITGSLSDNAPQGYSYEAAIAITNEAYAAIFKTTTFEFTVLFDYTWELVVGDDGSTKGAWVDGIFGILLTSIPYTEKEVEIYKAQETIYNASDEEIDYYRIANVYDVSYVSTIFSDDDGVPYFTDSELSGYALYNLAGEQVETLYSYFCIKKNGDVYFPYQTTGFSFIWLEDGYGYLDFGSLCDDVFDLSGGYYTSTYGVYEDGVISFPVKSIYGTFSDDSLYGYNMTESQYIFMPGTSVWAKINSIGLTLADIDAATKTATVDFEVDDITSYVMYTVVPYDETGASYDTAGAALRAGTLTDAVKITSFTNVAVTVDAFATYALVAVPFDAEGNAGKYDASTCVKEFRVTDDLAAGIAEGTYAVAKVVDNFYGETYLNVPFELTRSLIADYTYTSNDFFGWADYWDVVYTWTLDPGANIVYIEPTSCESYDLTFGTGTYYADSNNSYYFAYIGAGDTGTGTSTDPWQINVELKDGAYVMTTFATDAKIGLYSYSTKAYQGSSYDSTISAGTAVSTYVASYAPARVAASSEAVKNTTTSTSNKERPTLRKDNSGEQLLKK